MPYKYIGRTTDFKGKTLWEIVGNLKNYGVGRLVIRQMMQRYPEPCYMKILKVETLPAPENESMDNYRKVRVLVENTFRGVTEPKQIWLESTTYKTDYQLIPKDREGEFLEKTVAHKFEKILPKYMKFPPILEELLRRESTNGEENPKLEIVYNMRSLSNKYKVAEDGQQPTIEITCGLGTPASPNLYSNVKPT